MESSKNGFPSRALQMPKWREKNRQSKIKLSRQWLLNKEALYTKPSYIQAITERYLQNIRISC